MILFIGPAGTGMKGRKALQDRFDNHSPIFADAVLAVGVRLGNSISPRRRSRRARPFPRCAPPRSLR
ncbi:type IV secretory pathway VirB10-like protein [Pseudochelatococcus lubricantis]|uniref:Type IV secretory pathway VirB10-like protein n=1 Tax=Pseudochelatococcus lubricantis TaxID=1538102 RepID=A0ABX0V5J2_9HYPH|nr:hypothetical protein [Pseudochelatococcus lubricantis]NIJ59050.1 type IV secretory pathway VirB10-like protein [Pseudochelatococcus lubricantis]